MPISLSRSLVKLAAAHLYIYQPHCALCWLLCAMCQPHWTLLAALNNMLAALCNDSASLCKLSAALCDLLATSCVMLARWWKFVKCTWKFSKIFSFQMKKNFAPNLLKTHFRPLFISLSIIGRGYLGQKKVDESTFLTLLFKLLSFLHVKVVTYRGDGWLYGYFCWKNFPIYRY